MICSGLVERKLFKVKLQADPFPKELVTAKLEETINKTGLSAEDVRYFVLTGEACNTTYDPGDERINILFKDGSVRDISQVDNALIHHDLSMTVRKYYLCYLR